METKEKLRLALLVVSIVACLIALRGLIKANWGV